MSFNCNGGPVFAMTMKQPSKVLLRSLLLGSALAISCGLSMNAAHAQSQAGVSVDYSAIDPNAPVPVAGRIILRPPAGTSPISGSASQTIKLRPPQQAPKKAVVAKPATPPAEPKPVAEAPAPVKAPEPAAPVAAPTPAPAPAKAAPVAAAKPAAPAPTPTPPTQTAPSATPVAAAPKPPAPAPAPVAATPPPTTTASAPSAAAVKSAQQDQAGPVARAMPDTQQSAAIPPPAQSTAPAAEEVSVALTIPFAAGVTDIDISSQGSVKQLASRMGSDKTLRVQLMAYASDPEKNTSKARRVALDRAIAIRNLLIDAGVERTRIEVRALGDQGEGGNLDRVDAVAVKR